MTNSYDVLSRLHAKASAEAEKSVAEDLEKEDPPVKEGKAMLTAKISESLKAKAKKLINEDSEGNDRS
jgi:hypothetical protein|tara:strand:+ start:348 stop:551 length:204 start_codon:yes stop_codon:yes gene_type:complete